MARVLIGWELGANRGHISRIAPIAEELRAQGHDVALALQQVDALGTRRDGRIALFQAPIWPGLISRPNHEGLRVSTFTDILCRLGLDRPGTLGSLIAAWDRILADWRPDIVIAEFAPALLCAARGSLRTVSSGTGFVQPPPNLAEMPLLDGASGFDEAAVLDTVDAELRSVGREPLAALPAMFAADGHLVETFAELDPYRAFRRDPLCRPQLGIERRSADGDEVFAYGFARVGGSHVLWNALAQTRLRVRVCIPDAGPKMIGQLTAAGMTVHTVPLAWPEIAQRSRLIVSFGSHGLICGALIAGLPHVVVHHDLEKRLHGNAIASLGLGKSMPLQGAGIGAVAQAISSAYDNEALGVRANAAAPNFAARQGATYRDAILALVK